MTEVLNKLTGAVFGKDTTSSSNPGDLEETNDKHKTPAEEIKEKAIKEEVADGSTENGISTNTEEAHATDSVLKDNMSSKTDTTANTAGANTTTTTNGADDNASMIPLGKGGETAPPLNNTGTSDEGPTSSTSIRALEASSTNVTRAEIDSAKEAIIHAVANCKLTREVVFSDTDNGTEDGKAEVKRVISGYKGIDEALAEMNRYIPHNVRNSKDLGVAEGDRIRREQQNAAHVIAAAHKDSSSSSALATSGAPSRDLDEKITEKEALASTPTGLPSSTATAGESSSSTNQGGLTDLQKEELNRVQTPGTEDNRINLAGSPKIVDELYPGEQPEHERGLTLGAGILPGAGAAAAAIVPTSHVEDGKPSEPVAEEEKAVEPVAEEKAAEPASDGQTVESIVEDTAIAPVAEKETAAEPETAQKSVEPATSTTDKVDTSSHATNALPDTALLLNADKDTSSPVAEAAPESTETATSAAIVPSSSTTGKDATGTVGDNDKTSEKAVTSTPSSPTSPPQGDKLADRLKREVEERARRGQLGVYNKPLGTSASTASFAAASKGSDTSGTPTKAKEAPASSAFTEEFGPGETGLSPASPTGAAATSSSTKPPSTRARTASLSSQTSIGEKRGLLGLFRRRSKRQSVSDGSTGRRASQDLARSVSKDTTSTSAAASSPVTASAVPPAPSKAVETVDTTATPAETTKAVETVDTTASPAESTRAADTDDATGVPRKESPDDMLGPGAAAVLAAETAEKEKDRSINIEKDNEGDMVGPGALASALGETGDSAAPAATQSKSTTTAEPSTSEHKVEEVPASSNEVSTQTKHEPARALGTAVEPTTYAEEPAPSTGVAADDNATSVPRKESPDDMLGPGAAAVIAAETSEKDKKDPIVIDKENDGDLIGPGALAGALGETSGSSPAHPDTSGSPKAATADKGTSTSAEKGTSTEDDQVVPAEPATSTAPATATAATPVAHTSDDVALYSKPSLDRGASPPLERKNSKGGFFGLFRRRSSRRSSSGPPQRSVSDISKPVPVESTPAPTENHVTPAIVGEEKTAETEKDEVKPEAAAEEKEKEEEEETPFIHATDPNDPSSDAAKAELARSETEKEIAAEAEAYSEATIHAYGSLNVDELETVEEEMERGPEETVAEPHGTTRDDEEDEERDLHDPDEVASEASQPAEPAAASRAESPAAASVYEEAREPQEVQEERVASPVVAATPAERLLSGERRKSRSGGFFGLFRSRTRKDKDQTPAEPNQYADVVRNVGRVDLPEQKTHHKETRDVGTAMSAAASARSPSATRTRTRSVTSPAPGDSSIIDHGTTHEEPVGEQEEEVYEESIQEEEIPDDRSITEIAASIPLPAPVYTDKTRAKHERLRKKREREEAIERERIRRENEILAKRERIMTAYTGKQDFTKVPKPVRTKGFGRAHERKDLDGVQFVNKADKKAAKKDELTKTTSRGSSIDEPSSPSHPASGGLAGSFPAEKSNTRASHASYVVSDPDTEPGSPSPPTSPIVKLGRRVSALAHKREKPVEVAAA
ncbi:hypothetical protein P389DRAFT_208111 [Cystobasidium minutum MCA 4210]|uniref:uncharacterized protein n=1 Tax=Cystobasidium minutum MCA 4210 TaxID=1397322 RepID=UPI0034CF7457|eukprot:jgi/Rhomi1/208111/estExt_Genemark1.C_1_t30126